MFAERGVSWSGLAITAVAVAGLALAGLAPAGSHKRFPRRNPACGPAVIEPASAGGALHAPIRICGEHARTVVIRGWLASPDGDPFGVEFPGLRHTYAAITDVRGYFEVRIPREDFAFDPCDVPADLRFRDDQMSLRYHYAFE